MLLTVCPSSANWSSPRTGIRLVRSPAAIRAATRSISVTGRVICRAARTAKKAATAAMISPKRRKVCVCRFTGALSSASVASPTTAQPVDGSFDAAPR